LGVSKEQKEQLQKALQAMFQQIQAQQNNGPTALAGGGNQNQQFNRNDRQNDATRNRFENTIASVLTSDQMQKFRELRSQRRNAAPSARSGTLYTVTGAEPKAHEVKLGISDDRFTEVVNAGDLKAGDKVIVRARTGVAK